MATSNSLDRLLDAANKAIVLGVGGGGDVLGALATARLCESFACEWVLGGTLWERLPTDPEPGPRSLDELTDAQRLSGTVALASATTGTLTGVVFSEVHLARLLGRETLLVDILHGPGALAEGIADAADQLGADLVIFVDVGGDMLADGTEPGLASPLCDALTLAAAAKLQRKLPTVAAVLGPGCDGELTPDEVLGHVAEVARAGGWLGAWGLTPAVTEELERLAVELPTEVSEQPLRCARGEVGTNRIRQGRRTVPLSPVGALTFYLDPRITVQTTARLAQAVSDASSLEDANERLHKLGVKTEFDWERQHTET